MRNFVLLGLSAGIVVIAGLTLGLPLGKHWPTGAIFWELRLPRLLFALMGGAMIAVSAVIFQTTLRNRYIDGSMLGVASGSELGIALLAVFWAPALTLRVIIGAALAVFWLWVLRHSVLKIKHLPLLLPLSGLGLAMFFNAGTSLLTNQQGLLGKSLANVTIMDTWSLGIIALSGLILMQLKQGQLTLFALPWWHVARLGFQEARVSWIWQVVAAGYIGAASAVLGTVFFVGLIITQLIVRWLGGQAQQRLLPTALLGTFVLSLSDLLAHSLRYPVELPTGAVCMLITAPLFWLLFWGHHAD